MMTPVLIVDTFKAQVGNAAFALCSKISSDVKQGDQIHKFESGEMKVQKW